MLNAVTKDRDKKAVMIETALRLYLMDTPIKGFRILDSGAGTGLITNHFFELGNQMTATNLTTREYINPYIEITKQNNLRYNYFDIIISNYVFEHVKDKDTYLSQLYNCLKPKGIIYMSIPNFLYPIEPHTHMPLLHYCPELMGSMGIFLETYFKTRERIRKYFNIFELTSFYLKYPKRYGLKRIPFLENLPLNLLQELCFLSKSNIYILTKRRECDNFY